jgi:hypothetical protein
MKKLLLSSVALLALAYPAAAATIDLGVGPGGSVVTLASGGGTASVSGAMSGNFTIDLSGTGNPPLTDPVLLDGNTIDVKNLGTGPGTVDIWVSSTGNTQPLGSQDLLSSFTQNLLTAGWSVTADTYADNTNATFGTQQLLSTTTFTTSDAPDVHLVALAMLGTGPYSLSEEWLITAPGAGETNNTTDIAMSAVPLPAAVWLFGSVLGLGAMTLRRKKVASPRSALAA